MSNFTPATTPYTRVFLIEGRAAPDHKPDYKSCMKGGAPDQSFGDISYIKCPDPNTPGKYVVIGTIKGEQGAATMDLTGRYAMNLLSDLLRLARLRCAVDAHIHMGACRDLSDFNTYDKILTFENANLTNWSTSGDIGDLTDGDSAGIDEVAPISADEMYEIVPLLVKERGQTVVTTEVVDVVGCDTAACGECADESDGCQKFYAIALQAGGSPALQAVILNSLDKGTTWYADDIDSLGGTNDPSAIGCLGRYVVVVSNASNSLHYALKSEVDIPLYDELWTEQDNGFEVACEPNDCYRARGGLTLWIVGDGGYVYSSTDPTIGVTVVDAGVATADVLHAVHAYSDNLVLAGGANGALIYCTDGATFVDITAASPFGAAETIHAVWVKSRYEWWIGADSGELYYTLDGGDTWVFSGDFDRDVLDIVFANDTIMYIATRTVAPAGQIRRSINGGYSFIVLPETTTAMPANDRINALAACPEDPNLVIGVGLSDLSADGIIVVGSP